MTSPSTAELDEARAQPRLILASASPRRRELLKLLGMDFEVMVSRFEEPPAPTKPVDLAEIVTGLASSKAMEVAGRVPGAITTGADTLVTLSTGAVGVPLGKPTSASEAASMLTM